MSFAVVDTQPKRNPAPLDHGGRSMEEITDNYFSTMSPIGRKIVAEKRKCMESHRRDWDRLTQKERDSILDEWFIDPKIQLRYELKLGKKASALTESFPRLKVESGRKMVHYSEQEDGTQSKETVSWKDEFSGPFCWETKYQQGLTILTPETISASLLMTAGAYWLERQAKTTASFQNLSLFLRDYFTWCTENLYHKCQQELTILTPETISASAVPSPSISHDLIKVSDPADETDAEWFAKSNKDKTKLSVMLMRDVSGRNSLGNNLLASSSERLAFDQAVNSALTSKPKPKEKVTTNNYGNGERKSSQESLEKRKKTNRLEPAEKMKSIPPTSLRPNNGSNGSLNSGSKGSLNKELDRKMGSGGKGKEKNSLPSSHTRDSGSKNIEMSSPRRDSGSKTVGVGSPRRDSGSKSVGMGSPRRESGSKKKIEKKQLLPPGLLTELEKELKVQDNVNFDVSKQQKEERGQGDALTEGQPDTGEEAQYEFLFDW